MFNYLHLMITAMLACGIGWSSWAEAAGQREPARMPSFMQAKTFFQTNMAYDPRIALATDAVVVHRHGADLEWLREAIGSWKAKGFIVGRMFFADSDATNDYWEGRWDGKPRDEEAERDASGKAVMCGGVRPYMLPTEGWRRYLEEMTRISIEAGADAILPEEPLAHSFTGYEAAFKPMFKKRFGIAWQPEKASPEAHFLTCQLKAELFLDLEQRLARVTQEEAKKAGREVAFVMPVHGLYSNLASRLVAPMGMAHTMDGLDGYVGQVWTGPINWCWANYSSENKSFFASAYALYDYFVGLTAGTDQRMWLLADPVEDNPKHTWSEFQEWYRHCLAAKLMFPEVDAYEVMPWPDRIFLPGFHTAGGTPAPEDYRIALLSALQVLQEVSARPRDRTDWGASFRIGVAVGDSALWEEQPEPRLDGLYGLLVPLIQEGMWATVSIAERWTEPEYLDRFSVIVLSYENFKPTQPEMNAVLVEWVKQGGVLIVLGGAGELHGDSFWWTRMKHPSALHHLLSLVGMDVLGDTTKQVDKGWVIRREVSPRHFARGPEAEKEYLTLLADAVDRVEPGAVLKHPGMRINRGPFVVIHALRNPMTLPQEWLVDVLDPDLPVQQRVRLEPGQSGVYRDVSSTMKGELVPCVLHCTHRLVEQHIERNATRIVIRGPAETPAVIRLFAGSRTPAKIGVTSAKGETVKVEVTPDRDGRTLLIRFGNVPEGAVVEVNWN